MGPEVQIPTSFSSQLYFGNSLWELLCRFDYICYFISVLCDAFRLFSLTFLKMLHLLLLFTAMFHLAAKAEKITFLTSSDTHVGIQDLHGHTTADLNRLCLQQMARTPGMLFPEAIGGGQVRQNDSMDLQSSGRKRPEHQTVGLSCPGLAHLMTTVPSCRWGISVALSSRAT